MADPAIEVKGLREFRRDLKRLDSDVDRSLRGEIKDAAGEVLVDARSMAPIRTGALAKSLKVSVTTRGASIYSGLPYAPVVHWGGRIMPRGVAINFPRTQFISKAAERHADQLATDISDSVERAAKRAGWR